MDQHLLKWLIRSTAVELIPPVWWDQSIGLFRMHASAPHSQYGAAHYPGGSSQSPPLSCQPGRMAGHAGWLAHTGWVVCLCCVVFCLPPRLWVTIHTLPQVHLQGRLLKGSLAVVHHWFSTDVQIAHISFIQMVTVTLASSLTFSPPLTSLFFFLWQDHRCIHLCTLSLHVLQQ